MFKKITALLLAAIMLFSLFSCKKEDTDGYKEADNDEINPLPVMATENYEVTVSMMTYFLNSYYRSYVSNNQLYLGQLGLDPSKPLFEQKYSEEYTWLDYFLFYISDTLKQQLVLAEAAKEEGFELSEADIKNIDNQISYIDEKAAASENTTAYLIQTNYGECVNEETIRKCLRLTTLAKNYSNHLVNSYSFTDTEFEDFFKENTKDILSFSYIRYQATTDDEAKTIADFTSCKTEDEFATFTAQDIPKIQISLIGHTLKAEKLTKFILKRPRKVKSWWLCHCLHPMKPILKCFGEISPPFTISKASTLQNQFIKPKKLQEAKQKKFLTLLMPTAIFLLLLKNMTAEQQAI